MKKKCSNATLSILVDTARDEYAKERERTTTLDNKASFFITVIVAVVTISIPIIPFSSFVNILNDGTVINIHLVSFFINGLIASFICLICSFAYLYKAYKVADFRSINLDCVNEEYQKESIEYIQKNLCKSYKEIVAHNKTINDEKADSVSNGIRLGLIGFIVLIVCTIALIITIGG